MEEVKGYDRPWLEDITVEENIEEEDEFLYLELEELGDIGSDFHELGQLLDAVTTAEVNKGERYYLAVRKQF